MSDTAVHYLVTRPSRVGHLGDIVDLEPGHIVPAEVVGHWHPQAVAAMVDTDRMREITLNQGDLDERVSAQGVWERDEESRVMRAAGGKGGGLASGGGEPAVGASAEEIEAYRQQVQRRHDHQGTPVSMLTLSQADDAALLAELERRGLAAGDDNFEPDTSVGMDDETVGVPDAFRPPALDQFPEHIGGGLYKLSNGEQIRGKGRAQAVQDELSAALADAGSEE